MGNELDPLGQIDLAQGRFQELPLSNLQSVILPVVVLREHTVTLLGTAFNIAPAGLFVTAKHVAEEALTICSNEPNAWIAVIWMKSGVGYEDVPDLLGGQLPVRLIQINEFHDVALLQIAGLLENGQPVAFPTLGIDTRIPSVGTAILGIGYTKMDVHEHENSTAMRYITATQSCYASHGEVTCVYPEGRDSVMIPFPAFENSARFDPGMSGGPVFAGDTAKVCGVVCTGVSGKSNAAEFVSFASMMINALVLQVLINPQTNESVRLYDLVQRGIIVADDNFARIRVIDGGQGEPYLTFPGGGT